MNRVQILHHFLISSFGVLALLHFDVLTCEHVQFDGSFLLFIFKFVYSSPT